MANNYKILYKGIIQMQKIQSIVQYMRHGPPARDGIPPLHNSDSDCILINAKFRFRLYSN